MARGFLMGLAAVCLMTAAFADEPGAPTDADVTGALKARAAQVMVQVKETKAAAAQSPDYLMQDADSMIPPSLHAAQTEAEGVIAATRFTVVKKIKQPDGSYQAEVAVTSPKGEQVSQVKLAKVNEGWRVVQ